ncbi:hypothetical protein DFH06DRAFT_1147076 [Mycena polygramma]|nr:hypothetical protein DFH06DRAFT_1147076 [Mycena polygramma]
MPKFSDAPVVRSESNLGETNSAMPAALLEDAIGDKTRCNGALETCVSGGSDSKARLADGLVWRTSSYSDNGHYFTLAASHFNASVYQIVYSNPLSLLYGPVYRVFLYKPLGHKRRYKETVRNTVWVKISSVANGGRGILIRGYNRLSQQAVHVGRLCAKKVVRPPGRSSARSQPSRLLFLGVGTCARRPSHLGASGRIEPSSVSRQEQRSLIVDPHACVSKDAKTSGFHRWLVTHHISENQHVPSDEYSAFVTHQIPRECGCPIVRDLKKRRKLDGSDWENASKIGGKWRGSGSACFGRSKERENGAIQNRYAHTAGGGQARLEHGDESEKQEAAWQCCSRHHR